MSRDFDHVIIALDTPHEQKALETVRILKKKISIFKVGLELFCSTGPDIVRKINMEGCRVFLDLKFHDIPNTVAGAARAAANTGAFMFNVHASGGREMMIRAKEEIDKSNSAQRPLILAVTVLTSLDDQDLKDINITKSTLDQAVDLAKLAKECGLDGVVASPKEISAIRQAQGRDFIIVTPGVRPTWAAPGDQKRVMTPAQALEAGADYIVIGRPVTAAPDPIKAVEAIFEESSH
ncbi:MAG TPA: orotidine-5'-phosphate decarboxylase [Thermoanaerobacterales bacterium]|nr:orotidine-5'-phosphate decarboxylase [Thermoanaerobacterales bacterium]